MQRHYETVFIVTPLLTENQVKDVVGKYRKIYKNNGAELIHEENWGLRKLAYPIDRKSTGFYQLFEFKTEAENIAKLETELNRDEQVMRFLTVALDKYGIDYNEKRRKGELGRNFEKEKEQKQQVK